MLSLYYSYNNYIITTPPPYNMDSPPVWEESLVIQHGLSSYLRRLPCYTPRTISQHVWTPSLYSMDY